MGVIMKSLLMKTLEGEPLQILKQAIRCISILLTPKYPPKATAEMIITIGTIQKHRVGTKICISTRIESLVQMVQIHLIFTLRNHAVSI